VKVPHDSDDVGGKVDGDVLKQGVQDGRPLWRDQVGDEDGVETCCYDPVKI
jgi:hypothetical protein